MDQRIGNRIGGSTAFPQGPAFESPAPVRPAEVLGTFPDSGAGAVDEILAVPTAPGPVAAMVVEPVLGEGELQQAVSILGRALAAHA